MVSIKKQFISEFLSSFILAFMGLGMLVPLSVSKVIDLYQFCALFGLLIAFVIILFSPVSGAQFNPSVTLSMVISKRQSASTLIPYILAQFGGWTVGTMAIFVLFWNQLTAFTESGAGNAVNLFFCSTDDLWSGFWIEFIWTAFLMILILGCTDDRMVNKPGNKLFPFVIGSYILVAATFGGSYTGMALNAMRDLGPRIAGLLFGLINGYNISACFLDGQFILFLIAPTVGAIGGTLFFDKVISGLLPDSL